VISLEAAERRPEFGAAFFCGVCLTIVPTHALFTGSDFSP
jgi:hypothetical protein